VALAELQRVIEMRLGDVRVLAAQGGVERALDGLLGEQRGLDQDAEPVWTDWSACRWTTASSSPGRSEARLELAT
jgi:hypothetical protein